MKHKKFLFVCLVVVMPNMDKIGSLLPIASTIPILVYR